MCLSELMDEASLSPDEMGLVVGSGSGQACSDLAEADAIAEICAEIRSKPYLTSVKGITGECFESSFMLSTVAAIDMLNAGQIFPMWGRNPQITAFKSMRFPESICHNLRPQAMISSFSRYGMVGAMCINKYSDTK
jgi:3-oxoacyl-[acyl-carrier-protein] synthase II